MTNFDEHMEKFDKHMRDFHKTMDEFDRGFGRMYNIVVYGVAAIVSLVVAAIVTTIVL